MKRSHGTWLILLVCGAVAVYGAIEASYYVFPATVPPDRGV